MRTVAVAIWLVLLLASFAEAEEMACLSYQQGGNFIEWVEKDEPRGLRIVARDPKWSNPSLKRPANAQCDTCPNGQIANASFWLEVGGFSQARGWNLEATLADAVAVIFTSSIYRLPPGATVRAKTDAVPISLGDLTGLARRIVIEASDGWSGEMIALWVGKGCVSVSGLLFARSVAEIATDGLDVFAGSIGVEWYRPAPDPHLLDPPPLGQDEGFPLGDAFRRRYMERP